MTKVFTWVKEHLSELLGTVVAIVLGYLAWGAYNRKVGRLKDAVKVEKAHSKVNKLTKKVAVNMAKEEQLTDDDKKLGEKILQAKREVVEAHDAVEKRTNAEVVARFNQLYPNK